MSGFFTWRKLSAAKWEDVWWDRLSEVADRLAITALPGAKTIRLQAFQLRSAQAEKLRRVFGGQVAAQKALKTLPPPTLRAPIRVRGKLIVVDTEAELASLTPGHAQVLRIPAGMAFGTGDHATTSTCLRLLADVADSFDSGSWEFLDLGTGTGILALAARLLGAQRVDAGDFDPDSVRTARENARLNGISRVSVRKLDLLRWEPERTWPLVAANLFSGLLIEGAPRIAAALAPDGFLVFSGILRSQEADVIAAFNRAGLRTQKVVRKGKWVSGLATRPAAAKTRRNARRSAGG